MGGNGRGDRSGRGSEDEWSLFTIDVQATSTIQIQLATLEDAHLYLFGLESPTAYIDENDDDGDLLSSAITRELAPGTYYAKVRAYSASGSGMYTISVTR